MRAIKQWLDSEFNQWQLFRRPVAYAMTNNPVEQFNKEIKSTFSNYKRGTVLEACKLMEQIVKYYSHDPPAFDTAPTRNDKSSVELAQLLKPTDFHYDANMAILVYKHRWHISLTQRWCSCHYFHDTGICKHYYAACKLNNIPIDDANREFINKKGIGRPPKSNNGALNKK